MNHSCIINAVRLAHPVFKEVYAHADINALDKILEEYKGRVKRIGVVTDGIFSMRGDYAYLDRLNVCRKSHDEAFEEGIITIVDDSHGVGVFGKTWGGYREIPKRKADVLIATWVKPLALMAVTLFPAQKVILLIYARHHHFIFIQIPLRRLKRPLQ